MEHKLDWPRLVRDRLCGLSERARGHETSAMGCASHPNGRRQLAGNFFRDRRGNLCWRQLTLRPSQSAGLVRTVRTSKAVVLYIFISFPSNLPLKIKGQLTRVFSEIFVYTSDYEAQHLTRPGWGKGQMCARLNCRVSRTAHPQRGLSRKTD